MQYTGSTDRIVDAMLGWLKGLATWVLRLFNLYGGASPIDFLVKNWLKLLIILLVVGVVVDILVWLIRWRPHWVWFGKKRVVIRDRNFFASEKYAEDDEERATRGTYVKPKRDWVDNDFVVKADKKQQKAQPKTQDQVDVFSDEKFNVNDKHRMVDRYEDEVFNVEDLPGSKQPQSKEQSKNNDGIKAKSSARAGKKSKSEAKSEARK